MRFPLLAIVLSLPVSLFAQTGFTTHTYPAPVLQRLTAVDLNRDGYPDLVTSGGPVDVYLNDGHGGLLARKYIGIFAAFAAIADFNNDGLPDIATCHINSNSTASTIGIYLNRGSGNFSLAGSAPLSGLCTSLSAGNVDADGKPDVVATSYLSSNNAATAITTFFGNGSGGISRTVVQNNPSVAAQKDPTSIQSCRLSSAAGGDFQQAGRLDLVLVGACDAGPTNGGTIYYATSDKAGHYALKEITEDVRGYDYFPPYTSDVNGDGRPDVVLIDYQAGPHGSWVNNLDFLVNNGSGSFTLKPVFNENSYAASYLNGVFSGAAADFNKDGKWDAVAGFTQSPNACCTPDTPGIAILNGNSAGTYTESQRWRAAAYPYSTIAVDLNKDGRPDIATIQVNAKANTASLVTYINQAATAACSAPASAGVHVCSPVNGNSYHSPVAVSATGNGASGTVNHVELWIDGKKFSQYPGATINTSVTLASGSHRLVVVEVDSKGAYIKSSAVTFSVN